mgnify:CR=1 FL=1
MGDNHSMDALDLPILGTAEVRAVDACAIRQFGLTGRTLMQRAGQGLLDRLTSVWPHARTVIVVAGPGNNGGDGYVVAALLRARGLAVRVWAPLGLPLAGDAAEACADYRAAGGEIGEAPNPPSPAGDVVVDALFGTGLTRDLHGVALEAIRWMNACGSPILSADTPSGLDTQTGHVRPLAVRATETVTFVAQKAGFHLGQGPDQVGRLSCVSLGIPPEAFRSAPPCLRPVGRSRVKALLPVRSRTAHKGDHGHVLVIGGGPGMPGAVRLAGEAALRVGAGRVTVATHPSHAASVSMACPELMCRPVDRPADIEDLLASADVVALGPGLGQTEWAQGLFEGVALVAKPLVLDADGLNLLALSPTVRGDWILTPHPGEAARLLGWTAGEVQADRRRALLALVDKYQAVVALKGARTLVSGPGCAVPSVCLAGNPGMAAAGMGDVLTGVIAGLLGQQRGGADLVEVAAVAVQVHGQAGDSAAYASAYAMERGMLASDLFPTLRMAVNPWP